jgi:hypothetical protein
MKKNYLIAFFLMLGSTVFAQDAIYYKALYINKFYQTASDTIVIDNSVNAALKGICDVDNLDQLLSALRSNPFTRKLKFDTTAAQGANSFSFSSIAGIDVSNVSRGLSLFLIDRAKQELTIAFFQRFRVFSEKNPEFKTLFPKTYSSLEKLLDYSYPQMLPALRTAFLDDLKTVTDRIDDLIELPRYKNILADLPEIKICLRSIKYIKGLESGYDNAADILKDFSGFPEWNHEKSLTLRNTGNTLKLAALFSESIRNDANAIKAKGPWVPATDLKNMLNNERLFQLYCGLLYFKMEHDNLHFDDSTGHVPFAPVFARQADNIELLRRSMDDFFVIASGVNAASKAVSDKLDAKATVSNEEYYNYINASIDVLDKSVKFINAFRDKQIPDVYIAVMRSSNEIYRDVYTKKYASVFTSTIDLFDMIVDKLDGDHDYPALKKSIDGTYKGTEKDELVKMATMAKDFKVIDSTKVKTIIADIAKDTTVKETVKFLVEHYKLVQLRDFLDRLKPYGLFMASLIDAQSPDDVKTALENAVLPVGSSSVKKNTSDNIAIQAYLGAFLSRSNDGNSTWKSKFGVIAPIGIAYTPGFLSWKNYGAVSLFGALLDIGAIVDYDLKQDPKPESDGTAASTSVSKDYKVKLGQIFSPGGFLVYGFPGNLPLSIGTGWQYGPGLSKVDLGTNTPVINNPSWRWSVFFTVDIPLFNLMNKVKGK